MTSNIYDTSVYQKAAQVANIYLLGEKKKQILLKNLIDESFDIKISNEKSFSSFGNEKFIGYYYLPDIDAAHHLYLKEGTLFTFIKGIGEIPFIFKSQGSNEFWLGGRGGVNGRFNIQNGEVIGMILFDFSRAPDLIWRKLSTRPICKI